MRFAVRAPPIPAVADECPELRLAGCWISPQRRSGDRMMKKTLATLAVAATVAIGTVAIPTPADARWHRGFPVGPVIGGLAAGGILGAARGAPRADQSVAYEPV